MTHTRKQTRKRHTSQNRKSAIDLVFCNMTDMNIACQMLLCCTATVPLRKHIPVQVMFTQRPARTVIADKRNLYSRNLVIRQMGETTGEINRILQDIEDGHVNDAKGESRHLSERSSHRESRGNGGRKSDLTRNAVPPEQLHLNFMVQGVHQTKKPYTRT